MTTTLKNGTIFTQMSKEYDAYDTDIAVVTIFFETSTVFQFGSQLRLTW
jgi:hypothetical protein